ncbi:MAG: serine protease, partial [Pseudomonadota bacterium]
MIARLAALPIALFGLLLGGPAFAALDPAVREAAARSVVQVRALDCAGDDKAATGFVYGAADRVVTAHHVVAGCRRFAVFFEYLGGRTVTAEVERTLAEADLALLRLAEGPAPALRRASAPARVDDRLEALGYSLGRRSMSNTPVTVRFGSDRLAAILTGPVARELRASTSI